MIWQDIRAWHAELSHAKGARRHAWRLVVLVVSLAGVAAIYSPVAALTEGRSHDFMTAFDEAIPFVPWTWWIYFPGYIFGLAFSVFALQDQRIVYRSIGAIVVAQLINCVFYFVIPSTFPRPTDWQATGFTADAIYWYWTMDRPNNTFPSTHVAVAVVGALAMWRDRNRFRWVPTLTAVGVFITVHTTKQHYWIDAIAGVVVGFVAHHLVYRWGSRRD